VKLYCVRHGHTNYNELGLCNDDPSKDVHLTEKGKQQAQQAAEQLRTTSIDRMLVSELRRTLQTAEIINQYHHVPIETCKGLNDIRSGFDSLPVADYMSAIAHDPFHAKPNGAESLLEHKARILEVIHWIQKQVDDTLLLVAHEETLRVFIAYFNHLDDESMRVLSIANCELLEFEC
jgi:probable phosphoglycerate mutase